MLEGYRQWLRENASKIGLSVSSLVPLLIILGSMLGKLPEFGGLGYFGLAALCIIPLIILHFGGDNLEVQARGIGFSLTSNENTNSDAISENNTASQGSQEKEPPAGNSSMTLSQKESNPVQQTIDILESDLQARNFIEQSDNYRMDIVDVDEARIITELEDGHFPPESGLGFNIYKNSRVEVDGSVETFREWIGIARVRNVDEPLCVLNVVSWSEDLSDDPPERSNTLMQGTSWVEIEQEGVEDVEWDEVENARDALKSHQSSREMNHEY